MSALLLILMSLTIAGYFIQPEPAYNKEYYQPVIEEFNTYAESYHQQQKKIESRYSIELQLVAEPEPEPATKQQHEEINQVALQTSSAAADTAKININKATAEDFEKLPGIGPSIANNIVRYRKEHGNFTSIEELLNVRGIGEARLENIRSYITLKTKNY